MRILAWSYLQGHAEQGQGGVSDIYGVWNGLHSLMDALQAGQPWGQRQEEARPEGRGTNVEMLPRRGAVCLINHL
jgi:hypothetical protein